MITSKTDLKEYLDADRIALGRSTTRPTMLDYIWKYQILLRKTEYFSNNSLRKKGVVGGYYRILSKLYGWRLFKLGLLCGFTINLNSCGKGLSLAHTGPVIINGKLGEYCRVHVGVNIGVKAGTDTEKPTIGDRVYIGPGAKIFGAIEIADDCAIGANAVINKSFLEKGVTIGGVPAKIISKKGSHGLLHVK